MNNNVLFVDDDKKVLDSYRRVFRQEQFQMFLAVSAEHALEVLKTVRIDVIVTDYRMPGLSGLQLMSEIRTQHQNIRQIMVSGDANKQVVIDALNCCNIFRFFEKPCDIESLRTSIRLALQLKESEVDRGNKELLLRELERENPGITTVERDETGVVIVR